MLPEDGQQLRSKHVGVLINKYESIVQKGVEFKYEQISIKFGIDSLRK